MSAREFWAGLHPSRLTNPRRSIAHRAAMYPASALVWIWWRGIFWPIADVYNRVAWRYGWGQGRWAAYPGRLVSVHAGPPERVLSVDLHKGTLTTHTGTHYFAQCCDPVEEAE